MNTFTELCHFNS